MLPLQASALQNLEILSYYGEDRTFLAASLFYGKRSLENTVNQIRERVYPRDICKSFKKEIKTVQKRDKNGFWSLKDGAPGANRTRDLFFRRESLYPTELRERFFLTFSLFRLQTLLICTMIRKIQIGLRKICTVYMDISEKEFCSPD